MTEKELGFPADEWAVGAKEKPMTLAEANEAFAIQAPHQKAESLVGQVFHILSLRPQEGNIEGQDASWYFFATCASPDGEKFTTVLGGQAVKETLLAYVNSGSRRPLTVRLEYHKGAGRYQGYYTLENPQ